MRQAQLNFITMANATSIVLEQQKALWVTSKPIARLAGDIAADLALVTAAQEATRVVTTGFTEDKEGAGDAAITLAVRLAGFARVYALDQKNQAMAQQLSVTFFELDQQPDAALGAALRKLHSTMSSMGNALEEYSVTPAKLGELLAAIEKFDAIKSTPRVLISGRKANNESIPVVIRSLRGHFEKLDDMMQLFKDSHPQFYSSYKNARIILDLGTRHNKKEDGDKDNPDPEKDK